jgi:membrane protease YdiL (CAAX protease family)
MNALTTWIKRNSFVSFLVLTLVLSWWPWSLYSWGIDLGEWIFPLGPMLAALIVVPLADGWMGLKNLGRTAFRWRVGLRWYLVAIGFPILLTAVPAGVNILLGASASTASWPTGFADFFGELVGVFIIVGLGEEIGFSAFALPHLLRRRSVLATVLIMGLTRVIWHLPAFMSGGTEWPVALLLFPTQLIFIWLFIRSQGSALLMILAHCSIAAVGYPFFTALFAGSELTRVVWLEAAAFVIMAVIVVITSKTMRSALFNPDQVIEDETQPVMAA